MILMRSMNVHDNPVLHFEGYQISDEYAYTDLSTEELHVLFACCWMVDNRSTIRETALNCDYSYTTLWRRIHNECKKISPELYRLVILQMKYNLKNKKKR